MKIEIGQRWRVTPSDNSWEIERIFNGDDNKPRVILIRNGVKRNIQIQYLRSGYMLVGSDKEANVIKDWIRNGWPLASDVSRSPT
jgi:hypothetical protein